MFYYSLNNSEIEFIHNKLSIHRKVMEIYKSMFMFVTQSKNVYVQHANKLTSEYRFLLEGI